MAKRILLISSNSSGRGGGERYLVYLARGLKELGIETHALLSQVDYMDAWEDDLANEGVTVHRRPLIGLRDRPLRIVQSIYDRGQQQRIAAFCKEIHPDAILVNQQYDEDGLDYLSGALKADIAPVGGTMHMPMTAEKNQRPLGKLRGCWLQNWYARHPYQIMVVSKGALDELHQYYRLPKPAKLVHLGCTFSSHQLERPAMPPDWPDELPTIGFIGQLVTQKNLNLLIDAWLLLEEMGVQTKLLLVGDGAQRGEFESRLNDHARLPWHTAGWQSDAERYLQCIDIYAMTSFFEGLPLALVEAVCFGLPAVVTNFNGASDIAEITRAVTVVKERTPQSIAQALKDALLRQTELKELAKSSRDRLIEYFSVRRMAVDTCEALGLRI